MVVDSLRMVQNTTSRTIMALGHMFAHIPEEIVSNNGPQFAATEFENSPEPIGFDTSGPLHITQHPTVKWQKDQHDFHTLARCFGVGETVMVKNSRSGSAWIPGVTVQQLGLMF